MSYRTTRIALALAAGAASLAMSAPAEAGVAGCAAGAIDPVSLVIYAGPAFDCTLNTVGWCLFTYDPLFYFPTNVVPATTNYALCHV